MAQFDNPYETKDTGANPAPGIAAEILATYVESILKLCGISLYVHEHRGLASVMDAIVRAYPHIGGMAK